MRLGWAREVVVFAEKTKNLDCVDPKRIRVGYFSPDGKELVRCTELMKMYRNLPIAGEIAINVYLQYSKLKYC